MPETESVHSKDVLAALDRTPYGRVLGDTERRRQLVFEAMASSRDPMTREIGEQLASGRVAPRELLSSPEYRAYFANALAKAEQMRPQDLIDAAHSLARRDRPTSDAAVGAPATTPATDTLEQERQEENRPPR